MALRVWLPLTGTLENKGVSNITIENMGAVTANTAGKIGSCMAFTGTATSYLRIPAILSNTDCSIAFWAKLNSSSTAHTFYSQRVINNTTGFTIFQLSSGNLRFDDGASFEVAGIGTGVWHHVVCCRDATKKYIYVDGELKGSSSKSNANPNVNYALIGGSQNNAAGTPSQGTTNALNGYLNDYRIYDHCLSAAEVKEISQGLVLHYKLDSFQGGYGNSNLCKNSRTFGTGWSGSGAITQNAFNGFAVKYKDNTSGTSYTDIAVYNNVLTVNPNEIYTVSFWAKADTAHNITCYFYNNTSGVVQSANSIASTGASGTATDGATTIALTTEWKYYWITWTFKDTGTAATKHLLLGRNAKAQSGVSIAMVKLERGASATPWAPHPDDGEAITASIQDSSGYGHNGTIVGNLNLINNTPRYSAATNFNGSSAIKYTNFNLDNIWSAGMWFYSSSSVTTGWGALFTVNTSGGDADLKMNLYLQQTSGRIQYSANGQYDSSPTFTKDVWHHLMETFDGTTLSCYLDGVLIKTKAITNAEFTRNNLYVGARSNAANGSSATGYVNAYISDFRIYCTALSADDVLSLYHTAAKVDNLGGLHTFETIENIPNIIFKIDSARGAKVFQDGLSRYTQANCQVTLTDDGYRIYRPPNYNPTDNGNTMWGGLKLVNQNTDTVSPYNATRDNIWGLQQGHTYLWAFHAKGQSSNATSLGFTNNMGWSVGGVSPGPTILVNDGIPANFQGEKECLCIFTIGDNIIKTSNDNRGGYDGSSQYLSYRHLTLGWQYTNTGTLGTDIYLTNFRLYDITNFIGQIIKNGQANFSDFVEDNSTARILKNAEFLTNNLIER